MLIGSDCMSKVSQMPVILLPLHFDRDAALRGPSCQRSIALRPFITQDFMTGVPAIPGVHLPLEVCVSLYSLLVYDLIAHCDCY